MARSCPTQKQNLKMPRGDKKKKRNKIYILSWSHHGRKVAFVHRFLSLVGKTKLIRSLLHPIHSVLTYPLPCASREQDGGEPCPDGLSCLVRDKLTITNKDK